MKISLGVDIGGTGCKCAAFGENGEEQHTSYIEYPAPARTGTLSPDVLAECVFNVIRDCSLYCEKVSGDVAAITVSSFGESFVPLWYDGKPAGDIYLYYSDSRTKSFEKVVSELTPEHMTEITRIRSESSYSLAGMLSYRERTGADAKKYLFVASYIVLLLTGKCVCDRSLACRSLLYDARKNQWSREILKASGFDEAQLPEVLETGCAVGNLTRFAADRLSLSQSVIVVMGAHDQIVNAIGAGVEDPGDAAVTSGTCECITPLFDTVPGAGFYENNFACVPFVENSGFVTYAYNVSGGSVLKWFRDSFCGDLRAQAAQKGCSVYALLDEMCPKEISGITVLPFLLGRGGTPEVNPGARLLMEGVSAEDDIYSVYRGILEGLCFELKYNLEKLSLGGVKPERFFACGGGARSDIWLKIKADVFGRAVTPVKNSETGAMGSAILGFAALDNSKKILSEAKRFVRYGETVFLDEQKSRIYAERYLRYKKLRELQNTL